MPKYTSMSSLLQQDREYFKEVFDGTRFKLMQLPGGDLYALTYGDSKDRKGLHEEIEGELSSLGAYTISTRIYWEL